MLGVVTTLENEMVEVIDTRNINRAETMAGFDNRPFEEQLTTQREMESRTKNNQKLNRKNTFRSSIKDLS